MLDKIIRVNMSTLEVAGEKLPPEYQKLSGRALTSRVVYDGVPPGADPLGPRNKLVFACGLLAGTSVSSAGRLSAGAKSPLTGGIKESNAGGVAAFRMARLGVRAIVVDGQPRDGGRYALVLDKDGPRLEDATGLSMLGVYDKADSIYARYGARVGVILIGPAGERLQLASGITNNDPDGSPGRYCGRGGLGAVMGSKGLLAVVLDDGGVSPEKPARPDDYNSKVREIAGWIKDTPQTAEIFPKYGTAAMLNNTNALGALPTRNFSTGTFEGAEKVNGSAVYDTITARGGEGTPTHACMPGCLIRCSNIYPGKDGKAVVSPLEYETIGMLGPNCGIDDLDSIARINYLCNDFGVDTIEVGCALAVAMEAGVLPFGDARAALSAVEEIGGNTLMGRIMASGVATAGRVLGVRRIPAVKGQGMAAYDPRGIKGIGVTYATSPMGADHTAGNTARANVRHNQKEGQVEVSRGGQLGAALFDYLGVCLMLGTALKDRGILAGLVSDRFGRETTLDELMAVAGETLSLEREFNRRAGITGVHDRLPEFFYDEVNPASGTVFDITDEDLKA
ncbi:MAG: aldehyde ferredoxin oxidoreductase C-terminal domain-containing protein [Desulfocucumaceae bacterium]